MKQKLLKTGLELMKGKNLTVTKEVMTKIEPWLTEKGSIKLNKNNWLFSNGKNSCCLSTNDLFRKVG
jgi:hypothetical protein